MAFSPSTFYWLHCVACGYDCEENESCTICPQCGGQLDVSYNYDVILSRMNAQVLRTTPPTATKYMRWYPIQDYRKVVSLNEGGTPLRHCPRLGQRYGLSQLYVKNEGANPTGVFKDRGSLVELTKANEMGAKAVCCASTGNMAASVAAYAATAGIPCYVVVPEATPLGKLAQSISYGARIIQIRGTYADCVRLCAQMAKERGFSLMGDYAFRLEGQKSLAYEVIEQLGWKVPDAVIVPMGCGTHIAGIWKGFKEWRDLGIVDRVPRMIGVQAASVPAIVEAWRQGKDRYVFVDKPSTVCSAVAIGAPQDDIKALACIRDSGGYAETATDEETLLAEQELGRSESLFAEPSSALSIAVLPLLIEKGVLGADETIVCVSTGNGLKDPKTAISHLPDPPVLEPRDEEIERYFAMKLYDIKGSMHKNQVLFKAIPSRSELGAMLQAEFNIAFDAPILDGIAELTESFLQKGRSVSRADLQNIIEATLNEFSAKEKILEIQDFTVTDSKHAKAVATVTVQFHGAQKHAKSEGDGTFDAITNALESILAPDGLDVRLTDYSVGIDTPGTAAVVKVTMTMIDGNGNTVVATATSPDVIVASVDAFQKGYNILYWKNTNGWKKGTKGEESEKGQKGQLPISSDL